jgi:DNA (cytosine-5)-methyltransferase 1
MPIHRPTSLEICAGAGGQALGLEQAGFDHEALVEIDAAACATLRINRTRWNVIETDANYFDPQPYEGVDLVCGGVPCPPFSVAGKQLGEEDERDLFPVAVKLVDVCRPRAFMFENVRGLLDPAFEAYRARLAQSWKRMGYQVGWRLINASDFGVSQLRPRVVVVGVRSEFADGFDWPRPDPEPPPTVGELLVDLMAENGWEGAEQWAENAHGIAPTLVGGSKKHGGPDLGPTRAKRAWAELGVDGLGIADNAPLRGFTGMPRLTTRMAARIQGFPDAWQFHGRKTSVYRQVGNAFPPPVARAVGLRILEAIASSRRVGMLAS